MEMFDDCPKKSDAICINPGQYGSWEGAIVKNEDGTITIHKETEIVDIVAFLLKVTFFDRNVDMGSVMHLAKFIDETDKEPFDGSFITGTSDYPVIINCNTPPLFEQCIRYHHSLHLLQCSQMK